MKRHARSLVCLIREVVGNPLQGVEVGTWRGHTAAALLREFGDLTLTAVDPWDAGGEHATMPKTAEEFRRAREEYLALTEFARRRRVTLDMTSEEAAGFVADGSRDFVFVDAEHTYEAVLRDVRLWWPKLRPGGLMAGHDYGGVGDRTGRFGVRRAVDEWAAEVRASVGVRPGLVWWARR